MLHFQSSEYTLNYVGVEEDLIAANPILVDVFLREMFKSVP